MVTQLSTSEYAKIAGIARQTVLYRIDNGLEMSGVVATQMVGDRYVLSVDVSRVEKKPKKKIRKSLVV